MPRHLTALAVVLLALMPSVPTPHGGPDTASLRTAVKAFSATTAVDGEGWEAYAEFLHADFTRWFVGRPIVRKPELVSQIKTWWEVGMRVSADDTKIVHAGVIGDVGIVRFERTERYVDQHGADAGDFHGFVMQTWKHEKGAWTLLGLDIAPAPELDT